MKNGAKFIDWLARPMDHPAFQNFRTPLIATFLFLASTASAQHVSVTFYDSAWKLAPKSHAAYYRLGVIDTMHYHFFGDVKDYYLNGNLQMIGRYADNIKQDTFQFYYPDGTLRCKGAYHNNQRYGIWYYYYPNGRLSDRLLFDGEFMAALDHFASTGAQTLKAGTGDWYAQFFDPVDEDSLTVEGSFIDSLRNGVWNFYVDVPSVKDRRLLCSEKYNHGKFVKGAYYSKSGHVAEAVRPVFEVLPEDRKFANVDNWRTSTEVTYKDYPLLKFLGDRMDTPATFPGGMEAFYDWLSKASLNQSCFVKNDNQPQGRNFVQFVVDSTGAVEPGSVVFIEGYATPDCQKSILQVFATSPKWIPGRNQAGHSMSMRMVVPLIFGRNGLESRTDR